MHDLKWLESNIEDAKRLLNKRGNNILHDDLLEKIKLRKELILKTENLKNIRNEESLKLSKSSKDEIEEKRGVLRELSNQIKEGDEKLLKVSDELNDLLLNIPNIPHESVPEGKGEKDNVVIRVVGEKTKIPFDIKDHLALGELTDTIDMTRAAKISGSRFAFLKGLGAKLNRALLQYFLDYHVKQGDIELNVPLLVRKEAMIGTGQFPKFVDDAFKVNKLDDEPYYLIPTAEVPITNYFAQEIIEEKLLPLRYVGYSACFRAEAGAAGKDTKGMIRLHQFEKVEMVRFAKPEQAHYELEKMVERASFLLSSLDLPHRIIQLCGGDLGFNAENTFDLEVYLPSQGTYREISSCSSCGSFQARRAKIRFKNENKKTEYAVTLNGSGLPLGRTLVAIYENNQTKDGSINIPSVLWPYMDGIKVIPNLSDKPGL